MNTCAYCGRLLDSDEPQACKDAVSCRGRMAIIVLQKLTFGCGKHDPDELRKRTPQVPCYYCLEEENMRLKAELKESAKEQRKRLGWPELTEKQEQKNLKDNLGL